MASSPLDASAAGDRYMVVARRYRPRAFDELIGQDHVTKAISHAITSNRVGHAYLFTGARGVGKTSAARIVAKCLNCQKGPTLTPCGECDICMSVSSGEDVDVLEIDGASNRGIDEIRQLRANVNIRPSRARCKIFIIDEVHMLTKEAFNALLKTLEEPPAHVKFIFCTTDPEKIPITVLSRCQRYDFAPISTARIADRLEAIVAQEGATAERDALEMLARRAAGSMRDSQSLLEQLLSYGVQPLTTESVHQLLGTARHQQVLELLAALARSDVAGGMKALDMALQQGVDVGQFAEQLMLCLRDALVCSVGGSRDILLSDAVGSMDELTRLASAWGTPRLLMALQVLEASASRMRYSVQRRTLLEMALVQAAHLDDLVEVTQALTQLGGAAAALDKKKTDPELAISPIRETSTPSPSSPIGRTDASEPKRNNVGKPEPTVELHSREAARSTPDEAASAEPEVALPYEQVAVPSEPIVKAAPIEATRTALENSFETQEGAGYSRSECDLVESAAAAIHGPLPLTPTQLWQATLARLDGLLAEFAGQFGTVARPTEDSLVVSFPQDLTAQRCNRPEDRTRIELILQDLAGIPVHVQFRVDEPTGVVPSKAPRTSQRELIRRSYQHAFVQKAVELFDGSVRDVHVRSNPS